MLRYNLNNNPNLYHNRDICVGYALFATNERTREQTNQLERCINYMTVLVYSLH